MIDKYSQIRFSDDAHREFVASIAAFAAQHAGGYKEGLKELGITPTFTACLLDGSRRVEGLSLVGFIRFCLMLQLNPVDQLAKFLATAQPSLELPGTDAAG